MPPGTSKWNKIEHRLFSFITLNWRGKPLRSFKTMVQLIAATTTTTALTVRAELDENKYPKGMKISDAKLPPSSSCVMPSTVTGTTPYHHNDLKRLFMHNALGFSARYFGTRRSIV